MFVDQNTTNHYIFMSFDPFDMFHQIHCVIKNTGEGYGKVWENDLTTPTQYANHYAHPFLPALKDLASVYYYLFEYYFY